MENEKMKIPKQDTSEVERSAAKEGALAIIEPTLEHDIYLSEPLKKMLEPVLMEIKERASLGYLAGKGTILTGFPGTGKTTVVKKIAQDLKVKKIYNIDKEMAPKQISSAFAEARRSSEAGENAIVFIDEIDDFGQKEYAKFGSGLSKIVTLMTELDGVDSNFNPKGYYYVFAATNFPENVDERLLRPGRLEEMIEVPLPDIKARKEIIKIHQKNDGSANPHKFNISDGIVDYLSKKTNGYTPADLRSLTKHCCVNAKKRGKDAISPEDAETALNNFKTSVKRGFDYFEEPTKSMNDVIGRKSYKEFFEDILKEDEGNGGKYLLYGPRGTGKTLLPEALAESKEYSFIRVKGSDLQEGIVGEGTKKLKKLFQRAQMAAPCVVLLDEIKGMVTARNTISHKDDETAFLNSLLSRPMPGVYLFVTVNNPLEINETTLSRFGHKVFYELPDEAERKEYFQKGLGGGINGYATELAVRTQGYSFRDLEFVKNSLNRMEKKVGNYVNKNDSHWKEPLFNRMLSKYTPENASDETNWNGVKNLVGDSLEVEKFVQSLVEGGKGK